MPHHTERLARILPLLTHTSAHLGVGATPTGKRLGLTNTRMMALAMLIHGHHQASMSDLAAALGLSAPLATRTADELVERGLLERGDDPTDRRRVIVRPTAAGRRAFDKVHREAAELIGDVLQRMTAKEQDALVLGLEALLRAMHAPGAPVPDLRPRTHLLKEERCTGQRPRAKAWCSMADARTTSSSAGWCEGATRDILELADVRPGDRVLDIGTGPGYLARSAAKLVGSDGEAVGIDASDEMIARATANAQRESSSARFVRTPAQELPFEDGYFDAAVSRLVIHHLPGDIKDRALTEVFRVLKPGGRIAIADMSTGPNTAHHLIAHIAGHMGGEVADLEDLARRNGFIGIETGRVGVLRYVKARKPE